MMSRGRRAFFLGLSVALLLIVPLGSSILYIVNERELAVVLQFGEPVAERTEPGLYTKLPFVQEVRRFPKTYLYWEGSAPDDKLVDVTTRDSKKIEATIWALLAHHGPRRLRPDAPDRRQRGDARQGVRPQQRARRADPGTTSPRSSAAPTGT